jgi:type IV secretion system protein VirB4
MKSPDPKANQQPSYIKFIPFSSEVSPGVVKLNDGLGYCCSFEVEGIDFETCGDESIDTYNFALEKAVRSLDPGCQVWVHKIKSKSLENFTPDLTNDVCKWISDQYLQKLRNQGFVKTRLFVTIVFRPTFSAGANTFNDFVKRENEAIQSTEEMASRYQAAASSYRLTRLSQHLDGKSIISECLSLYGFLVNGAWEDVQVVDRLANHLIASSTLTFAERSGVIKIEANDGTTRYASCLEPRVYPGQIAPTQISDLLYAQQEFIETQSFSILSNSDAVEKLRRQRSHMISGGEASQEEIRSIATVIDEIRGQKIAVGEYHYNLTVFSDNLTAVKQDRSEIKSILGKADFKMVEQTTIPEAAWFFQCPGNVRMRSRTSLMTSRNFAALSPLHNFLKGKKSGNPWGHALCLFSSPSGQPFYFNFHPSKKDDDNTDDKIPGNTVIFGSTGTGKTTVETFLICMLNAYGGRTLVLDMDRSTEIAVRAIGGTYKSFRRGEKTGINPFQWPDTPTNRAFCKKVTTFCVTRSGRIELSVEEENRLATAVDTVYLLPHGSRRLGIVAQNLPAAGGNSLAERLRRWVGDGDLAWVIDNPHDTLNLQSSATFGFDYSEFIDDPEISGVFVSCMLQAAETLKDGRPFVLFMEEFWKPLETPALEAFVKDQLKTIRKENGLVVLTTQQPDDVTKTALAKTAVQQTQTGIFLPNPKAYWDDYQQFGLTKDEYEIVKALPEDSRCLLVKQAGKSAVCSFNLGGLDQVLSILSGNKENVLMLDVIRERVGDEPKQWLPIFLKDAS